MKKSDYEWIMSHSGNQGSSYRAPAGISDYCACKITRIYGKSSAHIFYLNIILYFKWLKRRIKRWFKQNILIRRKV